MQRGSSGFTLIEVMVVMVIIAILVTMVSLSLKGDRAGAALEEEAQRLTALLNLLREEAVMRDQTLGLALTGEGYVFVIRELPDPAAPAELPAFRPLSDDGVFRPRALPPGTRMVFETGPAARPLPPTRAALAPVLLALPQDLLMPEGRLVLTHPATPRVAVVKLDTRGVRWERGDGRP
ncbi:MAG: type II secretion system minor pseudopilin GspH [Pseudomonadota bacterium]|jgi:general secretion pathway protein H